MAVKHKFTCIASEHDYIELFLEDNCIRISGECWGGEPIDFVLDKPTSIKLAKTLRTEINKIQ